MPKLSFPKVISTFSFVEVNIVLNVFSVNLMERTVSELEAGNYDADDSEIKHRYDNQRQLNIQLQEQKRWLEHELEQVRQ